MDKKILKININLNYIEFLFVKNIIILIVIIWKKILKINISMIVYSINNIVKCIFLYIYF